MPTKISPQRKFLRLRYIYPYIYIIAVSATTIGGNMSRNQRLNPRQLSVLEAAFANDSFLSPATLMQLTHQIGVGRQRIMAWFRTKRSQTRHGIKNRTLSIGEYILAIQVYLSSCTCTMNLADFLPACCLPALLPFLPAHPLIRIGLLAPLLAWLPSCLPA